MTAHAPRPAGHETLRSSRERWNAKWYADGFYDPRSLGQVLEDGAKRNGRVEITFHRDDTRQETATLAELHHRARRLAQGLYDLGLRPGDTICIQSPNSVENTISCLAAFHLGLVIAPVVHIYGAHELGFIIRNTGSKALIIPRSWHKFDFIERFRAIEDLGALEHLIVIGDDAPDDALRWGELAAAESAGPAAPWDPGRNALIVFTSGSTGDPKGARHTHNTVKAGTVAGPAAFSSEPSPLALYASPAGHIGGMLNVLIPFVVGIGGHYLDGWDADLAATLIARQGITRSSGAPLHLLTLVEALESGSHDFSAFRYYVCGGASVPPVTIERAEANGFQATRSYGSSENPTITACYEDDPLVARSHTDGGMSPGGHVRVVDDEGIDVPLGHDGEVLLSGPKLFAGYTDPGLDPPSFTEDGWFRTGDVGQLDENGRLTITDRMKDIVVRAGENISSREVEDLLVRHPAVLEAAVVGEPDSRYGERACAFIRVRPGTEFDLAAARRHFTELGVAKQKTPERIVVVEEFPRSANGKIRKPELRDRLRGGTVR